MSFPLAYHKQDIFFFKEKSGDFILKLQMESSMNPQKEKNMFRQSRFSNLSQPWKKNHFLFAEDTKKVQTLKTHHWKCTNFWNFKLNNTHIIDSLIEYQREVFNKTHKGEKSSTDQKRWFCSRHKPRKGFNFEHTLFKYQRKIFNKTHRIENHLEIMKGDYFSKHKHTYKKVSTLNTCYWKFVIFMYLQTQKKKRRAKKPNNGVWERKTRTLLKKAHKEKKLNFAKFWRSQFHRIIENLTGVSKRNLDFTEEGRSKTKKIETRLIVNTKKGKEERKKESKPAKKKTERTESNVVKVAYWFSKPNLMLFV